MNRGEHILLIEDDSVDRIALTRALGAAGFQGRISTTTTAREALRVLADERLDLILLDLGTLGDVTLVSMRQAMAKRTPTPIVVLTGSPDESARARCLAAGAAGYFEKPAEWEPLTASMRTIVNYWGLSSTTVGQEAEQ